VTVVYVRIITTFFHNHEHNKAVGTATIQRNSIKSHFSAGLHLRFDRGEAIIHANEEPQGVYLIESGFVRAYSISQQGHEHLLLIHEAGEIIPLPWALDGAHTTTLRYEAMTATNVIRSAKDKLRAAMDDNARLVEEVMHQAANIINIYSQRVQTLEYRTARDRMISRMIFLADRFGRHKGYKILIEAPITHQDLADSTNMTRETASRTLELLFDEGLVGQQHHLFMINSLYKLKLALG
jgi:CRP-like cAMP-binding protein